MKNPDLSWFVWGISAKKRFEVDYSYIANTFWGISTDNQWFRNGNSSLSAFDTTHFQQKECEIDIYLDSDRGLLKLCVVDRLMRSEVVIDGLRSDGDGWVPHFNFGTGAVHAQIRLAKIPEAWYGKLVQIGW